MARGARSPYSRHLSISHLTMKLDLESIFNTANAPFESKKQILKLTIAPS